MQQLKGAHLSERSIVAVKGPERTEFLQGLLTNDVTRAAPDRTIYASLLTPQGKLLDDFFVVETGGAILLDVAAARAAELIRRLTAYKLRAKVEILDQGAGYSVFAVWGNGAEAAFGLPPSTGAARTLDNAAIAFVDPRVAPLGVRLILPAEAGRDPLAALGITLEAEVAYHANRLALGVGDSAEIGEEECYPLEANFEALQGVDFKKGCYVGQELTARMKHRAALRKRVLPVNGRSVLPHAGTAITADGREIGHLIGSVGTRGLALIRLDRLAESEDDPLAAGEVQVCVDWPTWLPR